MAFRKPAFQQIEVQRFLRAARKEGFSSAVLVEHPDGRREFKVALAEDVPLEARNSWDDLKR